MRRPAPTSLLASVLVAGALLPGSSGAAGSGIEGAVTSAVTLAARHSSPTRIAVTVTATIAPTRVTVERAGGGTIHSESFSGPVTRHRVPVRVAARGRSTLLVTAGPQTP